MLSLNNNCDGVQCLVSARFQKGIYPLKVSIKRVFKSVFWHIAYAHIVHIQPCLTYVWLECHILNYSHIISVKLMPLFASETGRTVPKLDWQDCSQVTLARLITSDTGTIVLK